MHACRSAATRPTKRDMAARKRDPTSCDVPDDLPDRHRWPKLVAIGMAVRDTMGGGKDCYEQRYYYLEPLLSGYKSNSDNWLEIGLFSLGCIFLERASKIGVFSKRVTLRICRIS